MSSEPADANAADEGVAKLQMVMEMDMQTWKVRTALNFRLWTAQPPPLPIR